MLQPAPARRRLAALSFFEPIPPPQERPAPRRQPPWVSPPDNELGVVVPIRLLLAKTDGLALAVTDVVAYSTGFALRVALRFHHDARDLDPRQMMMQLRGGLMGGGDDQLRFGIEFSDGRKATNLGPRRPPGDEPPAINLGMSGGGGGGGRGWSYGYWIYPLPPEGPVTIAFAWPDNGLPEQSHRFDAAPILEAAAQVEQLWDDDRPFGPGHGSAISAEIPLDRS